MSLPKDFSIKRSISHPLWDKFIQSLNEMDDLDGLVGHCSIYYGVDDCMPTCSPYAFGEVISLEYWNENADHIFKVGDYVIVKDKHRESYPEAKAGKIVDIGDNKYYCGYDTFIPDERKHLFRFATDQEIEAINPKPTFKVGDWILNADAPQPIPRKIMRIMGDRLYIDNPQNEWDDDYFGTDQNIRHATPEEIEEVHPFTLPEKWCIHRTDENCQVVNDWFNERKQTGGKFTNGGLIHRNNLNYLHYPAYVDGGYRRHASMDVQTGYTLLTYSQFLKYVVKKQDVMGKEIIGYKLINPEYGDAAIKLDGGIHFGEAIKKNQILKIDRVKAIEKFKFLGLLDLWFEPVYKPENIELKISKADGGVIEVTIDQEEDVSFRYKDSAGITEGLGKVPPKAIKDIYQRITEFEGAIANFYSLKIETISIGCQRGVNVKDLKKVLSTIKKQRK